MKIKENFLLRTLYNEKVVTTVGFENIDFNKLISLNSTAAFLWEKFVGKEFTVEDLANALTEEYDVDYETAYKDSENLAKSWIENNLVDE